MYNEGDKMSWLPALQSSFCSEHAVLISKKLEGKIQEFIDTLRGNIIIGHHQASQ